MILLQAAIGAAFFLLIFGGIGLYVGVSILVRFLLNIPFYEKRVTPRGALYRTLYIISVIVLSILVISALMLGCGELVCDGRYN